MTKKDILELKRRFTKNDCTFKKMCGCYVNGHKEIVTTFNETFLNLADEEFFKYLEIAKKTLSGTPGNNLLALDFPLAEENAGGRQQFLMGLRASELKNEELLNSFYQLVIDSYDYVGNFLILLYHDTYDVITKTNDNARLDESEEVYDYLLCSLCPVSLSKPGLGYREEENRIGARIRDWVVGVPENGFIFPAFTERSADIHSVLFYTKNVKEPHPEFMESGLGCGSKRTASEQKEALQQIVLNAVGMDEEKSEDVLLEIQEGLSTMVETQKQIHGKNAAPVILSTDNMRHLMNEIELPSEITDIIEKSFEENFAEMPPAAELLLDPKMLTAHAVKKEKQMLEKEVTELKHQLNEISVSPAMELPSGENDIEGAPAVKTYDVILRVKPQKVDQIKSQLIDGRKCLVIPMGEDECANVNGVNTTV